MSLTNEEKWGLKDPIWPQSRVQMAGRWWRSRQCSAFQLRPYWIVLFSSVWRQPQASSSYRHTAKAKERRWQQLKDWKPKTQRKNAGFHSLQGLFVLLLLFSSSSFWSHWSSWYIFHDNHNKVNYSTETTKCNKAKKTCENNFFIKNWRQSFISM